MEAATALWPHHWPFLLLIIAVPILLIMACFIKRPFIRSLKNKHVFITGGSSGIGLAIAKKALVEGAYVTLVSRSINNLSSAADILLKEAQCSPDNIRCEAADVGDYEALASAIKRAFEWRMIDVMVCNAGLTRGGYLGDGSLQDLEVTVRTNFMGSVHALHAALPLLKRRSRTHPISIVIMASLASLFFMYGHSVYTATKYAMRGLAEGLRFELLPYNIKVSLICPGFTSTPFLDEADKEKEICGLLKWVNLYSRRYAESADAVAKQTVGAMKSGAFMVTTNTLGLFLATLGRGFAPADSWAKVMMEVVLFFPVRVASLVCISIFRFMVVHQSVARHDDDSHANAIINP